MEVRRAWGQSAAEASMHTAALPAATLAEFGLKATFSFSCLDLAYSRQESWGPVGGQSAAHIHSPFLQLE